VPEWLSSGVRTSPVAVAMTYVPPSRPPKYRSSKRAWILVGILALTGVIGLAIFGVVASRSGRSLAPSARPGPAPSAMTCPGGPVRPDVNPDCYFLNLMKANGITVPEGQAGLISEGHEVCTAAADAGMGQRPISAGYHWVQRQHPDWPSGHQILFTEVAMGAYCPTLGGHPQPVQPPGEMPFQPPGVLPGY
jgi:hypothetical protein